MQNNICILYFSYFYKITLNLAESNKVASRYELEASSDLSTRFELVKLQLLNFTLTNKWLRDNICWGDQTKRE